MWEKIKSILTTTKYQVRIGLAVVLIFLGGYNLFFIGDDEGHGDNISIKIESGMSTEEIAQNLQEHAIINNGLGFRILARLEGKDTQFKEGIYYFRVGMNINSVLDRLVQGPENQVVRITIPEGFTVEDIANLLEKENLTTKEEFCKVAKDYTPYDYMMHMYQLLCEGKYMDAAYATAVVLLVMVIVINALSSFVAKKLTKK